MSDRSLDLATIPDGELQPMLDLLDPNGNRYASPMPIPRAGNGNIRSRTGLLKRHSCTVRYPDGREGTCQYTREGPNAHRFEFQHSSPTGTASLPHQYCGIALGNTPETIAQKAQEIASAAFDAAIRREQRDYFCRGTEPSDGSRKARPDRYQMSAKRAKEIAGKYALCRQIGTSDRLLPDSALFDSLMDALSCWQERNDSDLVIACCNRLDRCWAAPRFIPWVRKRVTESETVTNTIGG